MTQVSIPTAEVSGFQFIAPSSLGTPGNVGCLRITTSSGEVVCYLDRDTAELLRGAVVLGIRPRLQTTVDELTRRVNQLHDTLDDVASHRDGIYQMLDQLQEVSTTG